MSSYLVLARKYRPRTFDEVAGQEVVTRILRGAIEEGRVGHAYLFAGPRGTGKTTMARILAKCLNCEQGPTPTPCGVCEACRSTEDGSAVDVIELDAASHTGVDTIRELRDEVSYAPMRARTKVYIIDEVHMLSKGAFNALLKTLEEPPPHVVFLFATTEPHKVLDTILSRCQVLRLSPLSERTIAARLTEVFAREGVAAGPGVVEELARGARGGMRDALSLADKLLALAGEAPTLEDLRRLGGDGGARETQALLERVEAGDKAGVLELLAAFGGEDTELLAALLDHLRRALVLVHCGIETPLVPGAPEERAAALALAQRLGGERVELWIQELLRARERMRVALGQERIVLEATLLDLCRPEATLGLGELLARLERLEARLASGASGDEEPGPAAAGERTEVVQPRPSPRPATRPSPEPPRSPEDPGTSTEGGAGEQRSAAELWRAFLQDLARTHGALADLLERKGSLEGLAPGAAAAVVRLRGLAPAEERLATDQRNRSACRRALSRVAGREVDVTLESDSSAGAGAGARPTSTSSTSPRTKEGEAARSSRGEERAERDPLTRKVADLFGGVIEDLG